MSHRPNFACGSWWGDRHRSLGLGLGGHSKTPTLLFLALSSLQSSWRRSPHFRGHPAAELPPGSLLASPAYLWPGHKGAHVSTESGNLQEAQKLAMTQRSLAGHSAGVRLKFLGKCLGSVRFFSVQPSSFSLPLSEKENTRRAASTGAAGTGTPHVPSVWG